MSDAPNYFNFHLGDYARDCEELSLLQEGAYLRLMRWYYSTARPIPADVERINRRCHAFSVEERAAVEWVLGQFFRLDGNVWRHKRIDQELARWKERSFVASHNARERWSKNFTNLIKDSGNANAMQTQCEGNANQNQNQNQNQSKDQNQKREVRATRSPPPQGQDKSQNRQSIGTRLADDWKLPDDWRDWTVLAFGVTPQQATLESRKFADYFCSAAGQKARKANWRRAWQVWCRRTYEKVKV